MSEEEKHEQKPKGFAKAYRRAEKLIGSQQRLLSLLQKAIKKIDLKSGSLKTAKDELLTLVRLVKAYVSGNYRDVAVKTILSAIGRNRILRKSAGCTPRLSSWARIYGRPNCPRLRAKTFPRRIG